MTADEAMRIRMAAADVVANWDRWLAWCETNSVDAYRGNAPLRASIERLRGLAAEPQPADA